MFFTPNPHLHHSSQSINPQIRYENPHGRSFSLSQTLGAQYLKSIELPREMQRWLYFFWWKMAWCWRATEDFLIEQQLGPCMSGGRDERSHFMHMMLVPESKWVCKCEFETWKRLMSKSLCVLCLYAVVGWLIRSFEGESRDWDWGACYRLDRVLGFGFMERSSGDEHKVLKLNRGKRSRNSWWSSGLQQWGYLTQEARILGYLGMDPENCRIDNTSRITTTVPSPRKPWVVTPSDNSLSIFTDSRTTNIVIRWKHLTFRACS